MYVYKSVLTSNPLRLLKSVPKKPPLKLFILLKALPFNCPPILILYVLPLLDFASRFWNPHYSIDIATVEKVQHIFTRQVFYRCFPSPDYRLSLPSYPDRLKILGLRALTEWRVIGDLCMTHLIMSGNTIIPRSLFYVYKPQRDRSSSFGINKELTTRSFISTQNSTLVLLTPCHNTHCPKYPSFQ
uniref:G protein-coupled receptor n=1 Tax=Pristionchus pacificus TaxID=54126 RepID=A0A8R1YUA7_PRIPA